MPTGSRRDPIRIFLDVRDEERPTILVIGDHHHREHADGQLRPAIGVAYAGRHEGAAPCTVSVIFPPRLFYRDPTAQGRSLVYVMPVDKRKSCQGCRRNLIAACRTCLLRARSKKGRQLRRPRFSIKAKTLFCLTASVASGERHPAGGYSLPGSPTRTRRSIPGS